MKVKHERKKGFVQKHLLDEKMNASNPGEINAQATRFHSVRIDKWDNLGPTKDAGNPRMKTLGLPRTDAKTRVEGHVQNTWKAKTKKCEANSLTLTTAAVNRSS